jgi:hypothetical protein
LPKHPYITIIHSLNLFAINNMAPKYFVGVDGGTESIRAGVFTLEGITCITNSMSVLLGMACDACAACYTAPCPPRCDPAALCTAAVQPCSTCTALASSGNVIFCIILCNEPNLNQLQL